MASRRSQQVAVNDKARRAVSEFRKLQPTLTAFARVLTGNPKVRVVASTGVPRTDGKDIFIQPPIELGEQRQHDRGLCDQRDWDTFQQMCPACCVREEVMATTYHEISHIAFESFAAPDAGRLKEALGYVRQVSTPKQAERIIRRITESAEIPKSYMALASVINPYFKLLANSLEDVRINSRMHQARPGTKPMMDAQLMRVMSNGVTNSDGSVKRWTDMHLNHQASISAYLVASGFEPQEGWLADEVITAAKDEKLRELLVLVADSADAHQAFTASWAVFMRLRELGFYQLKEEEQDDEPEDEPEDQPEPPKPPTPPQPQQQSEESGDSGDSDDEADGDASADGESAAGGSAESSDDENAESDAEDESSDEGDEDESDSAAEDASDDESGGSDAGDDSADDDAEGEPGDDEAEGSSGESDPSDEEGDAGDGGTDDTAPDAEDGEDEEAESPESGDADEVEGDADASEPTPGDESDGGADSEPDSRDAGETEAGDGDEPEEADEGEDGRGDGSGGGDSSGGFRVEPDEAAEDEDMDLGDLGLHQHHEETTPQDEKAIQVAIVQEEYFEKPSTEIFGVKEWYYETRESDAFSRSFHAWDGRQLSARDRRLLGQELELPTEQVMGPALMRMRLVFAENKRTERNRNQRSGRLQTRALGKRAPFGDDRLFGKKVVPNKRDYIVLIFIDVSGSTAMGGSGEPNIVLIKNAAFAQAELCARMGVKFEILAHTGAPISDAEKTGWAATSKNLWLDIYHIKDADQPWDDTAKRRLADIGPSYYNLDGHTMEYARRRIERRPETDKVILYYSDGKMPLENYDEELEILQREIATCKQQKITLLGVGIRTDSPAQHGLDTVQVDDSSDVGRVVQHLERRLVS